MASQQNAQAPQLHPLRAGFYRHYKGMMYRVVDVVRHSESLDELVLYEALYENKLGRMWVRPKAMFMESVTIKGETMLRFTPVD